MLLDIDRRRRRFVFTLFSLTTNLVARCVFKLIPIDLFPCRCATNLPCSVLVCVVGMPDVRVWDFISTTSHGMESCSCTVSTRALPTPSNFR